MTDLVRWDGEVLITTSGGCAPHYRITESGYVADGDVAIVEIKFSSESGSDPITSDMIRSWMPLATNSAVRFAGAALARTVTETTESVTDDGMVVGTIFTGIDENSRQRRRKWLRPSDYDDIARVYLDAKRQGRPVQAAVARARSVSNGRAGHLIVKARKDGAFDRIQHDDRGGQDA